MPWEMKADTNGLDHMTKVAAMHIYLTAKETHNYQTWCNLSKRLNIVLFLNENI